MVLILSSIVIGFILGFILGFITIPIIRFVAKDKREQDKYRFSSNLQLEGDELKSDVESYISDREEYAVNEFM